jgi:hypothetical protein
MKKFINKNFQKKTYENFWNPTVWNKNLQKFKDKKFWEIYIKTLGENALNVSKKSKKLAPIPSVDASTGRPPQLPRVGLARVATTRRGRRGRLPPLPRAGLPGVAATRRARRGGRRRSRRRELAGEATPLPAWRVVGKPAVGVLDRQPTMGSTRSRWMWPHRDW